MDRLLFFRSAFNIRFRYAIGLSSLFLLFIFHLFNFPLFAETVFLKDGSTTQGRITSQTRAEIVLLTNRGAVRIGKERISRISFQDEETQDKDHFDPAQVDEILKKRAEREKTIDRLSKEKEGGTLYIEDMKVSRWEYVWRSALLPGWGHIYGRQWKEGIGYSSAFFLTAAAGAGLYSGAISSHSAYTSNINVYYMGRNFFLATPQDHNMFMGYSLMKIQASEATYHTNVTVANAALAGLGAVYLWQLAHAYWFGVSEEKKDEGLSFHVSPVSASAGVALRTHDNPRGVAFAGRGPADYGLDVGLTLVFPADPGGGP